MQTKIEKWGNSPKSLDWKIRNTEFCDRIPESVILEIFKKLLALLRFD
ncbi:MAG: hypothetical protein JW882_04640 [Deltaproteobacteria bacterium]|nr:hypothetical protein [Deltaproteobacteria bacterium]